jgi:hypothetical protein
MPKKKPLADYVRPADACEETLINRDGSWSGEQKARAGCFNHARFIIADGAMGRPLKVCGVHVKGYRRMNDRMNGQLWTITEID